MLRISNLLNLDSLLQRIGRFEPLSGQTAVALGTNHYKPFVALKRRLIRAEPCMLQGKLIIAVRHQRELLRVVRTGLRDDRRYFKRNPQGFVGQAQPLQLSGNSLQVLLFR
ncbi:hypothetical protein D3C75_751270 [compost metagenome]